MTLDAFTHVPHLWWMWGSSMAVLVGGGVAAWAPKARSYAGLAPVLVALVMLWFMGGGVAQGWSAVESASQLASVSAGLYQASAAGVWFGVPLVLACFALALPGAMAARDLAVPRPTSHVFAVVAGSLAVVLELTALAPATPVALLIGGTALSLLLWMVHTSTAVDPRDAYLVPVGAVAVWASVSGATTHAVLEGMRQSGLAEGLADDPWRLRAVAFGAALAYALMVGRRWGALALPVVGAVLAAGSSMNLLVALHTPAAEYVDGRPPVGRW